MKSHLVSLFVLLVLPPGLVHGQNVFIYDQQSSDENRYREGGAIIQSFLPLGQSFTPALTSVGFVRLYLYDGDSGNGVGATLYVNLRADSITGPILASTDPVVLPNRLGRPVDFFFSSPAAVIPGTTYYFQPVVQSGDFWGVNQSDYNYAGGTAFLNGAPSPRNWDLWFREGIVVVPEPSSALLGLAGLATLMCVARRRYSNARQAGRGP